VFTPAAARQTSRLARSSVSELEWIEHILHPFTSLLVVPVFALANAGVRFGADDIVDAATSPVTLGVVLGLVVGKAVGITAAARLAVLAGVAELTPGVTWRQISGVAALGGIGFTVSLFITELAFDVEALKADAKVGILAASVLATILGTILLRTGSTADAADANDANADVPPE